jgi:hypothetical protein
MLARSRAGLHRSLLALGLSLFPQLVTVPARAEGPSTSEEASALFLTAIAAAERGQLSEAARDFQAAYAISPNPVVLYNLGQTQSALGRPVEAAHSLRLYLETEKAPLAADREREVRELIAKNEQLIGSVAVVVTPTPEELEVDAAPVSPNTETLVLAAGRHVIVARHSGYFAGSTTVEVLPQAEVAAAITLQPVAREAPLPPPPVAAPSSAGARTKAQAPRAERSPAAEAVVWGGLGLGAVALGVGTGYVLSAVHLNSQSNADGHCNAQGCDSVGAPLRAAAITNGNIATGLLITGGALVGIGLTTYFITSPRDEGHKVTARLTVTRHSGDGLRLDLKVGF